MAKVYLSAVLCVLLLFPISISAQSKEDYYFQAEDFVEDGNYYKALEIYQLLLNEDPNNANLNFKVGFCYLNTATDKSKSIPYLEFASNHINAEYQPGSYDVKGAPIEVLYYLGKAYHVNYRIDDAERILFQLKNEVNAEDLNFIKLINHELASCQVARLLMKKPVEMKVSNLGRNVNSIYSEHSPVISGDESLLIFTSKRETNTGGLKTDDGQYFEDIYLCSFDGKNYTPARKISENINTPGHEASIGLSFDGTKLLIYKDDDGDGNIYVSNRVGAQWDVPEKLPDVINSKARETHASMSFDQNQIFFTSDRKGGYGSLDIYRVRKLPNGKWSKALNLGPEINTEYDEDGPYLHPDGTSLFFASQGHNTMGGFDIFVSYIDENDNWITPQNIGYPINTPDDDIYYVPSVDGRRAYYSSYANNSIGSYDIFRIDLSESHVRNQTVIAGFAISESGELLKDPVITLTDLDDELFGIYTPDLQTNKFLFILPRGKEFKALFESSNFPPKEYLIHVPEFAYDQTQQVVAFNDIVTPGSDLLAAGKSKSTNQANQGKTVEPDPLQNNAVSAEKRQNTDVNKSIQEEKVIQQDPIIKKEYKSSDLTVASELKSFTENQNQTLDRDKTEQTTDYFDGEMPMDSEKSDGKEARVNEQQSHKKTSSKDSQGLLWLALIGIPVVIFGIYWGFRKK